MSQIDFELDQQLLIALATEKAASMLVQAAEMEENVKRIRIQADSLVAESVARIATKNGVTLPKDGKLNGEWLLDKAGSKVGFKWPDAAEPTPQ